MHCLSVLVQIMLLISVYKISFLLSFKSNQMMGPTLELLSGKNYTRFFLYKNKLYKNTQAEIWLKF